jgi:hypothetical protein
MAMRSTTRMLTLYARSFGPNGNPRSTAISLPFVGCISDEKHYQPPPAPPPSLPSERSQRMTDKLIRRALGRPAEKPDPAFERVLHRIERGGV